MTAGEDKKLISAPPRQDGYLAIFVSYTPASGLAADGARCHHALEATFAPRS